jgi:hypothetical protein
MTAHARVKPYFRVTTQFSDDEACPDAAAVFDCLSTLTACVVEVRAVPSRTEGDPEPAGELVAQGTPAEAMARFEAWLDAQDAAEDSEPALARADVGPPTLSSFGVGCRSPARCTCSGIGEDS